MSQSLYLFLFIFYIWLLLILLTQNFHMENENRLSSLVFNIVCMCIIFFLWAWFSLVWMNKLMVYCLFILNSWMWKNDFNRFPQLHTTRWGCFTLEFQKLNSLIGTWLELIVSIENSSCKIKVFQFLCCDYVCDYVSGIATAYTVCASKLKFALECLCMIISKPFFF